MSPVKHGQHEACAINNMVRTNMKTNITPKLKITMALLITAFITQAIAFYVFSNIDLMVNGNLYRYGLRFDYAWAKPYWDSSSLFQYLLLISSILIVYSILLLIRFIRNGKASLTMVGYVLPFIVMVSNLFSAYFFTQIGSIVNYSLQNFGLQYSPQWEIPFLTFTLLVISLVGIATVLTVATPLLIHIGMREQLKTLKFRIDRPGTQTSTWQTSKIASFLLITTGTAALLNSILYNLSILAFAGLGLLFWGILFVYGRSDEYTKKSLVYAAAYPSITTIDQLIKEMEFKGTPVYLPPRYFKSPETTKVYIPKQIETEIPSPLLIQQQESQTILNDFQGLLITPPGEGFAKLFEKTLGTNLMRIDIPYLQQNLPKTIVEDLEIAQNFEMSYEENKVQVRIENISYSKTAVEEMSGLQSNLGSILASAIACVLTRTTGEPISIEKQQISKNGRDETIEYRILTKAQDKP